MQFQYTYLDVSESNRRIMFNNTLKLYDKLKLIEIVKNVRLIE